MKRLTAVALMVVAMALPACAQRSASRGGFSGHSGQVFHGRSNGSVSNRFAGSSSSTGSRSLSMARGVQRRGAGNLSARPGYNPRPAYNRSWRYRRPYASPYGAGIPFGVPGWIGPGFLGYSDSIGYDDQSASPGDAAQGYDAQPAEPWQAPEQGPPAPSSPYQPTSDQSHDQALTSPGTDTEEAVTLVFKDGRPAEQIHNYALTRTALYVLDQRHRDIPLDQLDLAATVTVNQDAGVDFHLPDAPK
jgi:hypothetical protein